MSVFMELVKLDHYAWLLSEAERELANAREHGSAAECLQRLRDLRVRRAATMVNLVNLRSKEAARG